jgi:Flp pilus assembly protein TadB
MITILLLGAGCGTGLTLLVYGLRPPAPSLAQSLARLNTAPAPPPVALPGDQTGWSARAGRPLAKLLAGFGLPAARTARHLLVLERSAESHLAEKALGLIGGLLAPPLLAALATVDGVHLGYLATGWLALLGALAGFLAPDLTVRQNAAARRLQIRNALSAFLDLTVITLAGGAGIESALTQAAATGDGYAFAQIRRALSQAQHLRIPISTSLGRLGEELGVPALTELSASLALAGAEGAKVRASLAAKAASLRAHALAEADAAAQSATERLSMPTVVMVLGFLVFLGYPAIAKITGSM